MYNLSSEMIEKLNMITGKLLGDGCITKQKGRNPRFQFIHSTSDKDWCFYCYTKLMHTIPLTAPYYKKVKDSRVLKGYTECYQVQSRTSPIITWLESIWYQNRKKILPFQFLEVYLNEVSLAWWYQDDGHLSIKGTIPKKIILSTDNFTPTENLQLIDFLEKKFTLQFKLDAQNRLILYDQIQIYYFLYLVEPYIHSSMKRKIAPQRQTHPTKKRTTVYLPSNIVLTKPTKEIHKKLFNLQTIFQIVNNRKIYIDFYKSAILEVQKINETKSYQIVIGESNFSYIEYIRNRTGLTTSQIVTICFIADDILKTLKLV